LLTLLLRYLRSVTNFEERGTTTAADGGSTTAAEDTTTTTTASSSSSSSGEESSWLLVEGDSIVEGNRNDGVDPKKDDEVPASFAWRAGRQRMTTGISIWSEPFFLGDAETAVLVLDTQGLFDNETTMGLTSCIFGLSTLMSSYQIYNVSNRIQEDHLQQLALFTEYGRMAVAAQQQSSCSPAAAAAAAKNNGASAETTAARDAASSSSSSDGAKAATPEPPFQRLEFLVRDWTEFDESMSDDAMEEAMATYLDEVLASRAADDLEFTREQIRSCFRTISCRMLPHPGLAVTKLRYDGAVAAIDPLFVRCVRRFAEHVFDTASATDAPPLEAKRINREPLTAAQLANYVRAYVGMFADGARFPQATTMLEATATANNRNAKELALDAYNAVMDRACGTHRDAAFLPAGEFAEVARRADATALETFDAKATMGRRAAILDVKRDLVADVDKLKKQYALMNDARNPFKNAEFYVLPLGVATLSWFVRHVTDAVCPEDGSFLASTCNRAEHALHQFYTLIIFLMLVTFYFKFKGMFKHVNAILKAAWTASLEAASAQVAASTPPGGVKRD